MRNDIRISDGWRFHKGEQSSPALLRAFIRANPSVNPMRPYPCLCQTTLTPQRRYHTDCDESNIDHAILASSPRGPVIISQPYGVSSVAAPRAIEIQQVPWVTGLTRRALGPEYDPRRLFNEYVDVGHVTAEERVADAIRQVYAEAPTEYGWPRHHYLVGMWMTRASQRLLDRQYQLNHVVAVDGGKERSWYYPGHSTLCIIGPREVVEGINLDYEV